MNPGSVGKFPDAGVVLQPWVNELRQKLAKAFSYTEAEVRTDLDSGLVETFPDAEAALQLRVNELRQKLARVLSYSEAEAKTHLTDRFLRRLLQLKILSRDDLEKIDWLASSHDGQHACGLSLNAAEALHKPYNGESYIQIAPVPSPQETARLNQAIEEIREAWAKPQTKRERMLNILAQNPGALIPLSELAELFEGSLVPEDTVYQYRGELDRLLRRHGFQLERVTSYRISPLEQPQTKKTRKQ